MPEHDNGRPASSDRRRFSSATATSTAMPLIGAAATGVAFKVSPPRTSLRQDGIEAKRSFVHDRAAITDPASRSLAAGAAEPALGRAPAQADAGSSPRDLPSRSLATAAVA